VTQGILRESSICQFDAGALVIAVPSAAVASKLRQILPGVREGLQNRGWKVISIQLRVQPAKLAAESALHAPRALRGLPGAAISHWQSLADGIPPSPLRDAICALVLRHRRRGHSNSGNPDT
jgi:hypothetical protein